MSERIAVVGAGAAGAGAAYALRERDVTVFEERAAVSGRAATRERHGCVYDHGANYVKGGDPRVAELVTETLDTAGLVDIQEPVWTFDAAGRISEGCDADDHKWTYRGGIAQLGERLLAPTDATVALETRVGGFERVEDGWRVVDADGRDLGRFGAVLATPPGPRSADLVAASDWAADFRTDLESTVRGVPYRTVITAVLGYPFELDRPYYALVNTDREHEIGWVSREECKPGHVPDGESVLIVQMAPDWSAERFAAPAADVLDDAAALVADLLDDGRLAVPEWTDYSGWWYALPDAAADPDLLARAEEDGLFFAGDWVAGEGRVHLALRSGLDAGERIAEWLA